MESTKTRKDSELPCHSALGTSASVRSLENWGAGGKGCSQHQVKHQNWDLCTKLGPLCNYVYSVNSKLGEQICSLAKRVYPETCRPLVQLRMENVCSRVCNHTSALTQVQSLNLYYLQGPQIPSPVISLQYCQVGAMPSSSWQNLLRRKTLSTQAPQESC